MLKDRRSSQKPAKYPRQAHLPTPDQLRDIYQTSVKNPNIAVELPFGDGYVLSASRKQTGGCEWTLYRNEDGNSMPEWVYNSTDPRWICMQIMSTFPNWNPVRQYTKGKSANDGWVPPPDSPEKDGTEHALMEGEIANVPLPSVFHSIHRDELTGKLEVHADGRVVTVLINDGVPVQCRLGKREGLEAFSALAAFTNGKFYFYSGQRTERRQLPKDLETLLQTTFGGATQQKPAKKNTTAHKVGTFKALGHEESAEKEQKEENDISHIRNPLYSEEAPVLLSNEGKYKSAKPADAQADAAPATVQTESGARRNTGASTNANAGGSADDEDPFDVLEAEFNPPPVQSKSEKKKSNPFGNLSQQAKAPSPFAKLEPHQPLASPPPTSEHEQASASIQPAPTKASPNDFVPPPQLESPVMNPFSAAARSAQSAYAASPVEARKSLTEPASSTEFDDAFDEEDEIVEAPEQPAPPAPVLPATPIVRSKPPEPSSPFAAPLVPIEPGSPFAAPPVPERNPFANAPVPPQSFNPFASAAPHLESQSAFSAALEESSEKKASPWGPPPGVPEYEAAQSASAAPPPAKINPWLNAQPAPTSTPNFAPPPANISKPSPLQAAAQSATPPVPSMIQPSWGPPPQPVRPTSGDIVPSAAQAPHYQSPPGVQAENKAGIAKDEAPKPAPRQPQFLDWPSMQPTIEPKKVEQAPAANKDNDPPEPWVNLPSEEERADSEHPSTDASWVDPANSQIIKPAPNLTTWMSKNLSQPRMPGDVIKTGEQPPLTQAELEQLWMDAEADFATDELPEDEVNGPETSLPTPKISSVTPMEFPDLAQKASAEHATISQPEMKFDASFDAAPDEEFIPTDLPVEVVMAINPSADHPVVSDVPVVEIPAAEPIEQPKSKKKSKAEAPIEPPSLEVEAVAEARNERTRKTKWPSQEIEIYKAADVHGYTKTDRFQVRMSLVNRETQLLAYPVLMYLTEMEFVRAARYNRSFSFMLVQIGVQPDDLSAPIQPLPNDGLALLGTKIMDIKRSPDLLGHFEDHKGLAILLPETERKSADKLAHRVAKMITELDVADWTNYKPLRFRIGLAGAPDNGTTLPQLISEALKYQLNNGTPDL